MEQVVLTPPSSFSSAAEEDIPSGIVVVIPVPEAPQEVMTHPSATSDQLTEPQLVAIEVPQDPGTEISVEFDHEQQQLPAEHREESEPDDEEVQSGVSTADFSPLSAGYNPEVKETSSYQSEVETSTAGSRILPGLTQAPVKYIKPPGLAEDPEKHWNGYSVWWTKLGNRIAKLYNYEWWVISTNR